MSQYVKLQRKHDREPERTPVFPRGGQALDPAARAFLEPRLGHSFGDVQVHADAEADTLAREFRARAFTVGNDIYFRSGAYDPSSPGGLHLLAHELAHTAQQAAGPVSGTEGPGGVRVSDPSDAFEQAAERAADAALLGGPMLAAASPGAGATGVTVQRWPEWLEDAGSWVADTASDAGSWVADTASDAWDVASDAGSWVADTASDAGSWVADTASDAWDAASDAGSWVADKASDAWDWTKENSIEALHTGLDVAGLIPGLGEIADGANALIYLAEGRYGEAALSAASMIPFAGYGATGAKWAGKLGKEALGEGIEKLGKEALGEGAEKLGKEAAGEGAERGLKDLSDSEIDDALRGLDGSGPGAGISSGPYIQVPASKNPGVSEGLSDVKIKSDPNANIAYHENMTFKGIDGAPHKKTEVRYHTANKGAPEGSFSRDNPTIQINSKDKYRLPDGTWKKLEDMTEAEKAAAHYPAY